MCAASEVFDVPGDRGNTYLILDGALIDVPKLVYEHDDSPECVQLFRGTVHEAALEVSPCLVVPSCNSRIWEVESLWRHVGVIAVSGQGSQTVIEHFRSLLTVSLDGGGRAYFRFYSPTKLSDLLLILSEQERSTFSGPVSQWGYWDEINGWRSLPVKGDSNNALRDEGWFCLSETHLAGMSKQGKLRFQKKLLRYFELPESPDNLQRVDALCQEAHSFDIQSEAGMAGYCELALTQQKGVKTPSVTAVLADADLTEMERLRQVDRILAYGGDQCS